MESDKDNNENERLRHEEGKNGNIFETFIISKFFKYFLSTYIRYVKLADHGSHRIPLLVAFLIMHSRYFGPQ